jgi:hypothetical protein
MVLGFKKEIGGLPTYFKDKILIGMVTPYKPENRINSVKHHTIRLGDRWKAGDQIHFAYGVRTKKYECFLEAPCLHVTPIWIKKIDRGVGVFDVVMVQRIGDKEGSILPTLDVCHNDGLTIMQFNHYFGGLDFSNGRVKAQIIHWTSLRYKVLPGPSVDE